MAFLTTPEFWIALSQIILINIVLSGDNAVVIAMASRSLPPNQQRQAILFGSIGAIVLRIRLSATQPGEATDQRRQTQSWVRHGRRPKRPANMSPRSGRL